MIGIVGPRGVGKTTLLLQHIKLYLPVEETLFVNADSLYFTEHSLLALTDEFYKNGGKYLFIDEIHKYDNWSQELKNIYDSYPDIKVAFTGSSVLDIYKGSADLSRRVLSYYMPGLSFREYLALTRQVQLPVFSLDEILSLKVEFPAEIRPIALFKEYLSKGYYPFSAASDFHERLRNIINLTVETDIPSYAGLNIAKTKKIKQLLYIISQSVPFKPNFSKLGQMIDINRNDVSDMLYYLERAGVIAQLRNKVEGIRLLGKAEKIYLGNTNLIYALAEDKPDIGNMRETFFFSQMQINNRIFSSEKVDFQIGDYSFEVGGRKKGMKQIEGLGNAYIVKDDIEYGYKNTIPLWHFGFNY